MNVLTTGAKHYQKEKANIQHRYINVVLKTIMLKLKGNILFGSTKDMHAYTWVRA